MDARLIDRVETIVERAASASLLAFTAVEDPNSDEDMTFVYAFANASVPTCTPVLGAPSISQSNVDARRAHSGLLICSWHAR